MEHKKKGFHKDEDGNLIVDNLLKDALLEIAILKKLNHKNVIKLHEIIHDDYAGEIILSTYINKKSVGLLFIRYSIRNRWR